MQVFKDPETGLYWQFGDSILVSETESGRTFSKPDVGVLAGIPLSLVPAQYPEPEQLPDIVPFSVSRYQGREAMRLTPHPKEGFPDWSLFDAFEELLSDPETPAYYRRAWDELQQFERDSAMLNDAADELGLTQVQRDNLFRFAAMLRA